MSLHVYLYLKIVQKSRRCVRARIWREYIYVHISYVCPMSCVIKPRIHGGKCVYVHVFITKCVEVCVQWFVCLNRVCDIGMWHNHPCTEILFSDCIYICTCGIHIGSSCHVTSMRSLLHVTSKCIMIRTCDMSMRSTRTLHQWDLNVTLHQRNLHVTLHQTVFLHLHVLCTQEIYTSRYIKMCLSLTLIATLFSPSLFPPTPLVFLLLYHL